MYQLNKRYLLQTQQHHFPVARCVAECAMRSGIVDSDDDVLNHEVLLCRGQCVTLTCNLWVEANLVNGVVGFVKDTFYSTGTHPPQISQFD